MQQEDFPSVTHLYLIRHGEAVGAVEHRILDTCPECGLTPRGVGQAERLRDRLAATGEIRPDVLIASTFPRARETAEIIAPAFGDIPVRLDPEVQELRGGEAEGLLFSEREARYGPVDFDRDPFQPIAPGGESWAGFQLRVAGALHRITEEYAGRTIVIVCHGGVVDAAFLYFLGLTTFARTPAGFDTHNTSITEWRRGDRRDASRWHLLRYNDALHLRDHVVWRGVSAEAETGADTPSVPLPTEAARDR